MNKTILLFIVAILLASCGCKIQGTVPYSQKAVESLALQTFLSNKKKQKLETAHWDYVPGLVAVSVLKAWQQYPEKTAFYDAVKAYADHSLQGGDTVDVQTSNIDDLATGKIFTVLYKAEMEKGNVADALRYKNCATFLRNKLKYEHSRIAESLPGAGVFFHKPQYANQQWLDGLYMGPAMYADWQAFFGEELGVNDNMQSWSDIALQFITVHKYTYDKEKHLNYHAWSATPEHPDSFWAMKDEPYPGCSPEFWGRGMGWYFSALVDVLECMPQNHADYVTLHDILNEVASGIAEYQDPASGCWYQLLQYDDTMTADGKGDTINGKTYNISNNPNYLEASASAMFTYAYLKGIRLGLLDREKFELLAQKAYAGILEQFIRQHPDGSINIIQSCASAGLGPAKDLSRSGTINYYLGGHDVTITQNEGKAIGPFIMASVEWEKTN